MRCIYAVTEQDVDGCGGEATEFVAFPQPLQPDQLRRLQDCLYQAKANAKAKSGDEDTETVDMVEDALRMFEARTGIDGRISGSPVFGSLSF